MFVEKEGFEPLWQNVDLAERYDLAIMSTKGGIIYLKSTFTPSASLS
jgi:hypothetical protein